jgi:hypothetical protein
VREFAISFKALSLLPELALETNLAPCDMRLSYSPVMPLSRLRTFPSVLSRRATAFDCSRTFDVPEEGEQANMGKRPEGDSLR